MLKDSQILLKFTSLPYPEQEQQRWIKASGSTDASYQAGNFTFFGSVSRKIDDNEMTYTGIRKIYDKYTFDSIGNMVVELKYSRLAQFMNILDSKSKIHYLVY
jgi:hypothetical protein